MDVEKTNTKVAFFGDVIKAVLDFFQNLVAYSKKFFEGLKVETIYETEAKKGTYDL